MYSESEKQRAVDAYFEWGVGLKATVQRLGGRPGMNALAGWVRADPRFRLRRGRPRTPVETRNAVAVAYRGGKGLRETAREYGVSNVSVKRWADEYGSPSEPRSGTGGSMVVESDDGLPDDLQALKRMVRDQQLELALLREVVDLVKKDPAANPGRLTNREKMVIVDRLRTTRSLTCLASKLS